MIPMRLREGGAGRAGERGLGDLDRGQAAHRVVVGVRDQQAAVGSRPQRVRPVQPGPVVGPVGVALLAAAHRAELRREGGGDGGGAGGPGGGGRGEVGRSAEACKYQRAKTCKVQRAWEDTDNSDMA